MSRGLRISPDLSLPLDAAADVTAIVGRRGRGKTTAAVVLVEEAHRARIRFCVVDPTGAWWGLRASRNGKAPGIPCVVFGGKHAMAPLEPTAGKLIAEFVADPSQPSAIIDVKPWSRGDQVRFLADFLATLYQKNDAPILLVLDEADQVAPQRSESPGEAVMLGAAQRLVKLGRVSGFGVVLVTQRPASLNKNVLNMAGILMAFGLTGPQDHRAVLDWMRHRADEAKAKEILSSLPGLPLGTAWVWAPEMDVLARVEVRDRETFDSSATPTKPGKAQVQPRALAEVNLEKLGAEIQATIERAKAEDPRELRRQVADLRAQLAKAQIAKPAADKPPKVVERPILKDAQVRRIEKLADRFVRAAVAVQSVGHDLDGRAKEILAALAAARDTNAQSTKARAGGVPEGCIANVVGVGRPADSSRPAPVVPRPGNGDARLPAGEHRVLVAVAQHPDGVTREQVTVLTGYKRSTRDAYIQRLRERGLVFGVFDRVRATKEGFAVLGDDFAPLPTGDALRAYWLSRLPRGERQILEALINAYPRAMERDAVSDATGFKRSTRDAYLQRLGARRLVVVYLGELRASHTLFGAS